MKTEKENKLDQMAEDLFKIMYLYNNKIQFTAYSDGNIQIYILKGNVAVPDFLSKNNIKFKLNSFGDIENTIAVTHEKYIKQDHLPDDAIFV